MHHISLNWDIVDPGLDVYFECDVKVGESFQISIITITGKILPCTCTVPTQLTRSKAKIQDKEGIPPDQHRLLFACRYMQDGLNLSDYGVIENSTDFGEMLMRHWMIEEGESTTIINIKYGPNPLNNIEIDLNESETKESLIERANEKIAEIKALKNQICATKHAKKKRKTEHDDAYDESKGKHPPDPPNAADHASVPNIDPVGVDVAMFHDARVPDVPPLLRRHGRIILMLKRENELRLSHSFQKQFQEAIENATNCQASPSRALIRRSLVNLGVRRVGGAKCDLSGLSKVPQRLLTLLRALLSNGLLRLRRARVPSFRTSCTPPLPPVTAAASILSAHQYHLPCVPRPTSLCTYRIVSYSAHHKFSCTK